MLVFISILRKALVLKTRHVSGYRENETRERRRGRKIEIDREETKRGHNTGGIW